MYYFIHINKTAGTSIESALGLPRQHFTALQKIAEVGKAAWERAFTFTVVRNPWDKVVSHYYFRVATDQTGLGDRHLNFSQWVRACFVRQDENYLDKPMMFMPQVDWICDDNGRLLVNFVARFESIDSDIAFVGAKVGRQIELPHLYKTNRGHYRDYYTSETRAIIQEWYKADVEAFDYHF